MVRSCWVRTSLEFSQFPVADRRPQRPWETDFSRRTSWRFQGLVRAIFSLNGESEESVLELDKFISTKSCVVRGRGLDIQPSLLLAAEVGHAPKYYFTGREKEFANEDLGRVNISQYHSESLINVNQSESIHRGDRMVIHTLRNSRIIMLFCIDPRRCRCFQDGHVFSHMPQSFTSPQTKLEHCCDGVFDRNKVMWAQIKVDSYKQTDHSEQKHVGFTGSS